MLNLKTNGLSDLTKNQVINLLRSMKILFNGVQSIRGSIRYGKRWK